MKNLPLILITTFGAVSLSACSKAESPKVIDSAPTVKVKAVETEEDHQHEFAGGVKTYHDIMSPDWHMDAGDERYISTCANVGKYMQKATALSTEQAPKGIDASAWTDATAALLAANKTLNQTCADKSKEAFAADFTNVHDKFHDLKELIEK